MRVRPLRAPMPRSAERSERGRAVDRIGAHPRAEQRRGLFALESPNTLRFLVVHAASRSKDEGSDSGFAI